MKTFADHIIEFNQNISFSGKLPDAIRIMNPFRENPEVPEISEAFYRKFYNDVRKRKLILGINPGRLGAGATGVPFTDTKRLSAVCDIRLKSVSTHEPSSVFIYDLIERYGGADKFYSDFYIHSICPLGFIRKTENDTWVNCNYYDDPELFRKMKPFIISSLKTQVNFGIDTATCYVLGKKNADYLKKINEEVNLFGSIIVLDHPRYIMQYRSRFREQHIADYLSKLNC